MGIPQNLQMDNELVFYGIPTHIRGMGSLIRLCLQYGFRVWFIPLAEPWRNGVIEKFNDHYQQRFLDKVIISFMPDLRKESLAFKQRHNSTCCYSKIKGKTPLKALTEMKNKLIFPSEKPSPKHPLDKPEEVGYHLVRFIQSDCRLNIFGEIFPAPPDTLNEYVVATVDVKEQKLKFFRDTNQVEEYKYQMQ